MMKNKKN